MLQYDSDKNSWSGLLIDISNVRKGIVDVGEEATKFFAKTQSWKPESLTNLSKINNIKFDKFIEQQGLADESLVAFLRDTNYAQKDLANYQLYLKNTGKATSTFATLTNKANSAIKSIGATLGSMVVSWAIGQLLGLAIKGIDAFIHREENLKEALDESITSLETTTSEIESLEAQVTTCTEKIAELQKLKDAGTISLADEEELNNLKEENEELERQIALLQDKQIREGKQVLKDAKKQEDDKVQSRYKLGHKVTPSQELHGAVQAFIYAQNTDNDALADEHGARVEDMYEKILPTLEAYRSLEEAGYDLSDAEEEHYAQLKKAEDEYLLYTHLLNGTKESFVALSEEMQKQVLIRDLFYKKGMTQEQATAVVENIKPEDYVKMWESDFEFTPPDPNDYDSAEEYGKAYADAWIKGAQEGVEENANKMTVSLSDLEKASEGISKLSSAFKELSDDGYITTKTLNEIKTETGLADEEWCKYESVLLNAKKGSSEFNQAMGDLTYAILENKFGLEGLNEANEANIVAVLRENGVTNAGAVAQSAIARAKAINANETENVTYKTLAEIEALISEGFHAGWTSEQFKNLIAQHIVLNNTTLNLGDKIAMIESIGRAAGWSAAYVSYLIECLNSAANAGRTSTVPSDGDRSGSAELSLWREGLFKPVSVPKFTPPSITTPNYGGTTSPGGGSGGSGDSSKSTFDDSYYSTLDAWLEEDEKEIERLEKEREAFNRKFENALDSGNKEQSEILRSKLIENAQSQKKVLEENNRAHRISVGEYLEALYKVAPDLKDKAWDEITDVELTEIEHNLTKTKESATTDDDKNNASLNLNRFKGLVEDIKKLNETIKGNSEAWWDRDNEIKDYWQSQIDFQENYSREWIDNQKSFDRLSEEEELAAYGRIINNNKEFQKQIIDDERLSGEAKLALIKETNDLIIDAEKDAYELRKDIFSKATDFLSSYKDSQKTLLQSYFDVTNSIAEAQHDINKELETSKTMYEWLDEDTRQLLFNQEDYNTLSEELYDIQYKADKLRRQYERDLNNSTLETVESITSQYEMQYETLMKSYEIAKADLEIAKKKQQLNNVLNERNVRMFINGQWQWVANTEDVINAKAELADAEYAKRVEEAGLTQQNSINELTKRQDELGVVIKKFEGGVIDLDEAVRLAKNAIGSMPSALSSMYSNAGSSSSKSSSYYSGGSSSGSSGGNTAPKNNATATIPGIGEVGIHINDSGKTTTTGLPTGTVVHTDGGDYKITGGTGGNYTSIKVKNKYADGTNYTKPGTALMGEEGKEIYIDNNGHYIPIDQPTLLADVKAGGVVFNTDQMKDLRTLWDMSNFKLATNRSYISRQPQQVDQRQDNRIIINGMTVDSGSSDGQDLISALRRYVGNH